MGDSISSAERRTRVVDRLVIHGAPIDFRELCRRALPLGTRYLILDLDRTVHLGRNMGELLGWELCAFHSYGPEYLAQVEARRGPGRFLLDWSRPLTVARYLAFGARMWAYPGLYYLFFAKIPARLGFLRRLSFRRFGAEPVVAVQRVPQTALMHQLAAVPSARLKQLARGVWERHAGDQILERGDLEWLRARCPGIKIIVASASPQSTLEVAAEALGVDDTVYSTLEEHAGYFSSPFQLHRLFLQPNDPRRISGPSQMRINSSRAKIETLFARYPELADPDVVSVGITDTGYGEDHCWVEHFTRVIDVNSPTPFPPVVRAASPVQEVHSAAVLTRHERARRAAGEDGFVDPRRPARRVIEHSFTAAELADRLAGVVEEAEALVARLHERASGLADARRLVQTQAEALRARIEAIVAAFNEASEQGRAAVLAQLRGELRKDGALRRQLARIERPLSDVAFALTRLLESAREGLI
jgi:hypothetical protein